MGQAAGSCQCNTACTRALPETLLNDLAVETQSTTVRTGVGWDVHAIDPPWKVSKGIGTHRGGICHGCIVVVEGQLVLGR
jgi:hypothetical protein